MQKIKKKVLKANNFSILTSDKGAITTEELTSKILKRKIHIHKNN